MKIFDLDRPNAGAIPLLLSIPHAGTQIPTEIAKGMTDDALATPDTDWLVDELYSFAQNIGATVIKANLSRFVVDLNRAPDSAPLYADGRQITGVIPTQTFSALPIYRNQGPDAAETEERIKSYHVPYHNALQEEISRILTNFGVCLLFDAHSIKSLVPSIHKNRFPHLIIGTADSSSCDLSIEAVAENLFKEQCPEFNCQLNTPFKGGYITRTHGKPAANVHAIQLEMTQDVYLDESNNQMHAAKLARIAPILEKLFLALSNQATELGK